jgi:hypothetical protein
VIAVVAYLLVAVVVRQWLLSRMRIRWPLTSGDQDRIMSVGCGVAWPIALPVWLLYELVEE